MTILPYSLAIDKMFSIFSLDLHLVNNNCFSTSMTCVSKRAFSISSYFNFYKLLPREDSLFLNSFDFLIYMNSDLFFIYSHMIFKSKQILIKVFNIKTPLSEFLNGFMLLNFNFLYVGSFMQDSIFD